MNIKDLSRTFTASVLVAAFTLVSPQPGIAAPGGGGSTTKADPLTTARKQLKGGNYGAAIVTLTKIIQIDGYNADARNLLGYAYRHDGRLEDAARAYEAALRLKPRHRGALEYQGELFLILKAPEKAQANLDALAAACASSCEEYHDLDKAIQAYQAGS